VERATLSWSSRCSQAAEFIRSNARPATVRERSRKPTEAARCHPPACRARIEGEEMTGKNSAEVPNMRQRMVLQHLSLADWRMADRLPVSAGEMTLSRLLHHGWIESRGEKQRAAVRLTPAGLKALRSPIGKSSAG